MTDRGPALPGARCWSCGKGADGAKGVTDDEATPADGDVLVCLYCSAAGVVEGGKVRRPHADELAEIEADVDVARARAAVDLARATGRL